MDLGANDGQYSRLAAEITDTVVAVDSDALVIVGHYTIENFVSAIEEQFVIENRQILPSETREIFSVLRK